MLFGHIAILLADSAVLDKADQNYMDMKWVLSGETVLAARKRPALTTFHDQESVSLFQDIA